MKKQVPPEKTKEVLDFATKRPRDRLASISNGLSVSLIHSGYGRLLNQIHRFWLTVNLSTFDNLA
jgi:hypothetical protein